MIEIKKNDRIWEFQRYGISLSHLVEADIEMVRQWRNDPKISKLMLDKSYISEESQKVWFKRMLMDKSEKYFLAFFKGKPIGVASLIKIDPETGTAEPGMYIYDDDFINNIVPFCVAFALNDFAFEKLKLTRLFGKIYLDNEQSIRFHQASGYQFDSIDEKKDLQLIHLDQQPYDSAKQKITKFIRY